MSDQGTDGSAAQPNAATSTSSPFIDARISKFKADLASPTKDVSEIIRRHITTGDPAILDGDVYFELRRQIAQHFVLHPSSVVLVGSCRLGFSLKLKGKEPRSRYHHCKSSSDVDIAVVSTPLFDSYWDNVFGVVQKSRNWALRKDSKTFVRDLFSGWITPGDLPNLPSFADAARWQEFFDGLTQSRVCGIRTVNARLYRDWARLEAYQAILVSECRNEIALSGMRG
jgi:hypothetical protein